MDCVKDDMRIKAVSMEMKRMEWNRRMIEKNGME
jgi:hypothetical protein